MALCGDCALDLRFVAIGSLSGWGGLIGSQPWPIMTLILSKSVNSVSLWSAGLGGSFCGL